MSLYDKNDGGVYCMALPYLGMTTLAHIIACDDGRGAAILTMHTWPNGAQRESFDTVPAAWEAVDAMFKSPTPPDSSP